MSSALASDGPTRPVLRWHGGKWRLAPWIIAHFPPHRVYVEPYGGGASVLLRKSRSYAEVYNDLDGDVVTLFRVLRNDALAAKLIEAVRLTPFARTEFEDAYGLAENAVERARRLLIRSFMGFGSNGHNAEQRTGFRANSNRSGTTPAHDWANYAEAMPAIVARLHGVVIENKDACAVMQSHDGRETLHYVDPPYIRETRSAAMHRRGCYAHEMDIADHVRLLERTREFAGMVVLSGYSHPLYDDALRFWRRVETRALADGARERTEVLWLNPACDAALARDRGQRCLFEAMAAVDGHPV